MGIVKVWIDEGCIVCGACGDECPDVFLVTDSTCFIRGTVREDDTDSENREEGSLIKEELRASLDEGIRSAAAGCPVEVIRFE